MGFEIRHSQVLCAPQYASALANAMRQFGLDGLLVSYSMLACGFAPTRAIALTAEQAIEFHDSFQPPRCPESLCCTKKARPRLSPSVWHRMPLTSSVARRSHRALASDDVLSTVFSFIDPLAGFGAATASKTLRNAWRRRCKGMLRVYRQRIGTFEFSDHCVAYGDGVMVPNYGRMRNNGSLQTFSADGTLLSSLNSNLDTPMVVALRGDGTAWVLLADADEIVCVRLAVLPEGEANEILMRIGPISTNSDAFPESLVLAGDSLLVLCGFYEWDAVPETASNHVNVYDNQTGAFLRKFSLAGADGDAITGTMAVQGDMLYVTCKQNNSVDEYRWRDGTFMRSFGGGGLGVAVRGKTMYVSEAGGRQIQVLRIPDDDSSEPTVLQVIPSPDGHALGGLCVNGDRLWCMGPKHNLDTRDTYVHLFGPCY